MGATRPRVGDAKSKVAESFIDATLGNRNEEPSAYAE